MSTCRPWPWSSKCNGPSGTFALYRRSAERRWPFDGPRRGRPALRWSSAAELSVVGLGRLHRHHRLLLVGSASRCSRRHRRHVGRLQRPEAKASRSSRRRRGPPTDGRRTRGCALLGDPADPGRFDITSSDPAVDIIRYCSVWKWSLSST